MKNEQEPTGTFDEEINLNIFDLDDEEASTIKEDFEEEEEEKEESPVKKSEEKPTEDDDDSDDDSDDSNNQDDNKQDDDDEEVILTEEEKVLSEFIESGKLLLPEDYEYESSKEGLSKAFEDSEKYRNQLAFQEAVKFLISEKGIDYVKVQKTREELSNLEDTDSLDTDSKLELIRQSYQLKGLEEDEIDELLEEAVEDEKYLEREVKIASRLLKKEKEKELLEEAQKPLKAKEEEEKVFKESQELLKNTLEEKNEINGYILSKENKPKIYNAIYKPIKTKEGNVTTEFNKRLEDVLNHPEKILVLADLLINMDEKGFKFDSLMLKAESQATDKVKKTLRQLKDKSGKSKVTGRTSQSSKEFDLSKASIFTW